MKKASDIFEKLRDELNSPIFANICRMNESDFVRRRVLSCQVLVLLILNLLRRSIANELIFFISAVPIKTISRSAVSKARLKLAPQAFIYLNEVLINEFYTDNPINKFMGFILMGVDGSMLELPINSADIIQRYGGATNQTEHVIPMARTSWLYDVLNGVTIDAIIAPYCTSERDMAIQHIERLKEHQFLSHNKNKFLHLYDRGYPSVPLLAYHIIHGIDFVMRCNTKFISEVNEFIATGAKDGIITFSLDRIGSAKKELQKLFPNLDKNKTLTVRIVCIKLPTGEEEILLTSLLDSKVYPHSIFFDLYAKRWGSEENYKFQKVHLSIENFSGKSCLAVQQDFHATVLNSNAYAIIALEAQSELTQDRERKYEYKINRNVGVVLLKNEFVKVLVDPLASLNAYCERVKITMKRNLVPIRPGRSFERRKHHPHRKWHMNLR